LGNDYFWCLARDIIGLQCQSIRLGSWERPGCDSLADLHQTTFKNGIHYFLILGSAFKG